MNASIVEAIENLNRIEVYYDGGIRIIEPHCYGKGTSGQELLRCFQESGHSNSGQHHNWKLFSVPKMQQIEILDDHFDGPRPKYNPNGDKAIPHVYAML